MIPIQFESKYKKIIKRELKLKGMTKEAIEPKLSPISLKSNMQHSIKHSRMQEKLEDLVVKFTSRSLIADSLPMVRWAINRLVLSPDFMVATVYWYFLSNVDNVQSQLNIDDVQSQLDSYASPLKTVIAKNGDLRFVPKFIFKYDKALEQEITNYNK